MKIDMHPITAKERDSLASSSAATPVPDSEWRILTPVPDDAPPPPNEHPQLGRAAKVAVYRDRKGRVLFLKYRFNLGSHKKKFAYLTYWEKSNGQREWRWLGLPGTQPLYRQELLNNVEFEYALVTEGEAAADAGQERFPHCWVTTSGGASSAGNADWSVVAGLRVVIWPDADEAGLRYANDVAQHTAPFSKSVSIVNLPKGFTDGWDFADELPDGFPPSILSDLIESAIPFNIDNKSTIVVEDDRVQEVINSGVAALGSAGQVHQRGRRLVRVVEDSGKTKLVTRAKGAPIISLLPLPTLMEFLAASAHWMRLKKGDLVAIRPPDWAVKAIDARGHWSEIPHISGIVEAPTLRTDGSVLTEAGYDEQTGLVYKPQIEFPEILADPKFGDAQSAFRRVTEPFVDFPIASPNHRAALLSAILTIIARHAIDGTVPLFLIDANTPGSGKTLLADLISILATGNEIPRMAQAANPEEEAKQLAGIAMEGDRVVLIDNITKPFGGAIWDMVLTSTRVKFRILGRTGNPEFDFKTVFLGTSNNGSLKGDTTRRTIHIRLCSSAEYPERRDKFRHDPIVPWVKSRFPRLLVDGLTILRAYLFAGRPCSGKTRRFGFDAWTELVQESVFWLTGQDCVVTQEGLETYADLEKEAGKTIMAAWSETFPGGGWHSTKQFLSMAEGRADALGIADAVQTLVPAGKNERTTAAQLSKGMSRLRERVVDGRQFIKGIRSRDGQLWLLCGEHEPNMAARQSDADVGSDEFPAAFEMISAGPKAPSGNDTSYTIDTEPSESLRALRKGLRSLPEDWEFKGFEEDLLDHFRVKRILPSGPLSPMALTYLLAEIKEAGFEVSITHDNAGQRQLCIERSNRPTQIASD